NNRRGPQLVREAAGALLQFQHFRAAHRLQGDVPMKVHEAASQFLANKRIAVTGVSRSPQAHGANVVYRRLRERGYQVFAVNPNADEVEGDRSYHELASIPGGVEAVVIAPRP